MDRGHFFSQVLGRRVGKAKRAHHLATCSVVDGGHVASGLCPPPTGTEPVEQSCHAGTTARETDLVDGQKPGVERALDALNFFLADVRDGLGPYLAIYLLTEQKWDEASIGIVMSVAALAGIIAQTPAGALIDRSTAKRALMVTAAILVTHSCIA